MQKHISVTISKCRNILGTISKCRNASQGPYQNAHISDTKMHSSLPENTFQTPVDWTDEQRLPNWELPGQDFGIIKFWADVSGVHKIQDFPLGSRQQGVYLICLQDFMEVRMVRIFQELWNFYMIPTCIESCPINKHQNKVLKFIIIFYCLWYQRQTHRNWNKNKA
jgi:hypothetical protein